MKYICRDQIYKDGKTIAQPGDLIVIGDLEGQIYNVTAGLDIKDVDPNLIIPHMNNIHDNYCRLGSTESSKEIQFKSIIDELFDTYKKKNADYGDSFDKSLDEWGLQAAAFRMDDKMNRFKSLVKNGSFKVKDESVLDTLKDLANYCIMTVMYLENGNNKNM